MNKLASLLYISCALLGACTSSSDVTGDDDPTPPPPTQIDTAPPSVRVAFPPRAAVATSASSITVRGTSSDDTSVQSVTVNGIAATSDDGFATWSADVPLVAGENALVVSATDAAGNAADADLVVAQRDTVFAHGTGPIFMGEAGALLVPHATEVQQIDLATGKRAALAALSTTSDNVTFTFDTRNRAIVALERATGRVVEIFSGSAVIEDGTFGGFGFIESMAYDPQTARLAVLDDKQIVMLDLLTGERTIIGGDIDRERHAVAIEGSRVVVLSGAGAETVLTSYDIRTGVQVGLVVSFAVGDVFAISSGTAYVGGGEEIEAIDLATGDARIVSELGETEGGVAGLATDGGTLIASFSFGRPDAPTRLRRIDTATGALTPLQDAHQGSGPEYLDAARIAVALPDGGFAVMSGEDITGVSRVAVDSLARTDLPALFGVTADAAVSSPTSLFVAGQDRVLEVPLSGGDATALITRPGANVVGGIALDDHRLIVSEFDGLVAVDLTTHATTTLAATAPLFAGLVLDRAHGRLIGSGGSCALTAIALSDGSMSCLPTDLDPARTKLAIANGVLYAAGATVGEISAVDLETGAATPLASAGTAALRSLGTDAGDALVLTVAGEDLPELLDPATGQRVFPYAR